MKTCNGNKHTFRSVGIIHAVCKRKAKLELLFTPNAEHSASDGVKEYAVFLPTCKCTDGVATALCKSRQSVPITVPGFKKKSRLVAAATEQTAVEVKVAKKKKKKKKKRIWTLKRIAIPAPRTKK